MEGFGSRFIGVEVNMRELEISPTTILAIILITFMVICGCYYIYQEAQFKSTATETCQQIVDKDDNQSITVRDGNYVNTKLVYHGYDVCVNKLGTLQEQISVIKQNYK
jgi:hypothetical protein